MNFYTDGLKGIEMKKLLLCLLLMGCCQKSSENIKLGDRIKVVKGFFSECVGEVEYLSEDSTVCGTIASLYDVTCPKRVVYRIDVDLCYLKKIKD